VACDGRLLLVEAGSVHQANAAGERPELVSKLWSNRTLKGKAPDDCLSVRGRFDVCLSAARRGFGVTAFRRSPARSRLCVPAGAQLLQSCGPE